MATFIKKDFLALFVSSDKKSKWLSTRWKVCDMETIHQCCNDSSLCNHRSQYYYPQHDIFCEPWLNTIIIPVEACIDSSIMMSKLYALVQACEMALSTKSHLILWCMLHTISLLMWRMPSCCKAIQVHHS
jgi:hypothetical protein